MATPCHNVKNCAQAAVTSFLAAAPTHAKVSASAAAPENFGTTVVCRPSVGALPEALVPDSSTPNPPHPCRLDPSLVIDGPVTDHQLYEYDYDVADKIMQQ
jgi:hypothetical protein